MTLWVTASIGGISRHGRRLAIDCGIAMLVLVALVIGMPPSRRLGAAETPAAREPAARSGEIQSLFMHAKSAKGEKTRLELLDRIVALAGTADHETFMESVIPATLARASLLDDKAEILRGYDVVLEEGLRRAATFTNGLPYGLKKVLTAKSAFTGDFGIRNRYYDAIIAANANPTSVASAWLAKANDRMDRAEQIAVCDRILAAHRDSPDRQLQRIACIASFRKARLSADDAMRNEIYDQIIAKYETDIDPNLRWQAVRALVAKAYLAESREAMLQLYDRIIECCRGGEKELQEHLLAAVRRKERLMGDAWLAERFYDELSLHQRVGGIVHDAGEGVLMGSRDERHSDL